MDRRPTTRSDLAAASTRPTRRRTCATRRPSPLDDVRRGQLRHEPAGADRHLRRPTATSYHFLFVAKGGGSANKTLPLPGDEGAPQPGEPREVPRREDADARHRRLPALPPRLRHRRHLGRGVPEDGQARLDAATSTTCRRRATSAAGRSATSSSRRSCSRPRARPASARSSAASTSRSTCASSACRATARRARSAWASRARPTATSRRRSTATASGSRSSSANPGRFIPATTAARLDARASCGSTSTGR